MGRGRDVSEDSKRRPAAKSNPSTERADPPLWSPWNFQFPNPNREAQEGVYRKAHASTHARDEAK